MHESLRLNSMDPYCKFEVAPLFPRSLRIFNVNYLESDIPALKL